jgi:hypothetical protein
MPLVRLKRRLHYLDLSDFLPHWQKFLRKSHSQDIWKLTNLSRIRSILRDCVEFHLLQSATGIRGSISGSCCRLSSAPLLKLTQRSVQRRVVDDQSLFRNHNCDSFSRFIAFRTHPLIRLQRRVGSKYRLITTSTSKPRQTVRHTPSISIYSTIPYSLQDSRRDTVIVLVRLLSYRLSYHVIWIQMEFILG